MVGIVYLYSTSVKIWKIEIAEKTKETRVKQASMLNTHTHTRTHTH